MAPDKQSFLQDLQARLSELVRTSPAGDLERNLKAMLGQAFQRLELVTRDELDDYAAVLAALRGRVVQLEEAVAALEGDSITSEVIGTQRPAPQDGGTPSQNGDSS